RRGVHGHRGGGLVVVRVVVGKGVARRQRVAADRARGGIPAERARGARSRHEAGDALAPDGDLVGPILQAHVEGGAHALVAHVLDGDDHVYGAALGDGAWRRDARDREVRNGRGRWRG